MNCVKRGAVNNYTGCLIDTGIVSGQLEHISTPDINTKVVARVCFRSPKLTGSIIDLVLMIAMAHIFGSLSLGLGLLASDITQLFC